MVAQRQFVAETVVCLQLAQLLKLKVTLVQVQMETRRDISTHLKHLKRDFLFNYPNLTLTDFPLLHRLSQKLKDFGHIQIVL